MPTKSQCDDIVKTGIQVHRGHVVAEHISLALSVQYPDCLLVQSLIKALKTQHCNLSDFKECVLCANPQIDPPDEEELRITAAFAK